MRQLPFSEHEPPSTLYGANIQPIPDCNGRQTRPSRIITSHNSLCVWTLPFQNRLDRPRSILCLLRCGCRHHARQNCNTLEASAAVSHCFISSNDLAAKPRKRRQSPPRRPRPRHPRMPETVDAFDSATPRTLRTTPAAPTVRGAKYTTDRPKDGGWEILGVLREGEYSVYDQGKEKRFRQPSGVNIIFMHFQNRAKSVNPRDEERDKK